MKTVAILSLLPSLGLGAPLLNEHLDKRDGNPGRYIAILKKEQTLDVPSILQDLSKGGHGLAESAYHRFNLGGLKGFAATLNATQLARVKGDSRIQYLEPDGRAHTQVEAGVKVTQSNAPWGLGRISHRSKGSTEYLYQSVGGEGACAYIIDTGITPGLAEVEGRATFVKSFVGDNTDQNGHGTHVMGTIGSKDYGVARKVKLYGIKVLDADGSGSWSDIIMGIQTAVSDSQTRDCPKGVVVNMSLGGAKSQAVNDASTELVNAGLFLAVAAGNEAGDYHKSSPASASGVVSVGASDINDNLASFSNYGRGMSIIAPGVNVESTLPDGSIASYSGTSMATPHVVGLAAYIASQGDARSTPDDLKAALQKLATKQSIAMTTAASVAGTPNLLAFNGADTSTAAEGMED